MNLTQNVSYFKVTSGSGLAKALLNCAVVIGCATGGLVTVGSVTSVQNNNYQGNLSRTPESGYNLSSSPLDNSEIIVRPTFTEVSRGSVSGNFTQTIHKSLNTGHTLGYTVVRGATIGRQEEESEMAKKSRELHTPMEKQKKWHVLAKEVFPDSRNFTAKEAKIYSSALNKRFEAEEKLF